MPSVLPLGTTTSSHDSKNNLVLNTSNASSLSNTSALHSNHSSKHKRLKNHEQQEQQQQQLSQHSTSLLSNHSIQVSNISSIHMDSSPEQQQQQQQQNMSNSNDFNSKNEVIPSSQVSVPSSSNQTLITGHHNHMNNNKNSARVVAETPPILSPSSMGRNNSNSRKRHNNSPLVSSKDAVGSNKNTRKSNGTRKKRAAPVRNTDVNFPTPGCRKKRHLQFPSKNIPQSDDNLIVPTSTATTTTISSPPPVAVISTGQSQHHQQSQSYNESTNNACRGSNSNPGRVSKNDPPANNKKILDFFGVRPTTSSMKDITNNNNATSIPTDSSSLLSPRNTTPTNNEANKVKSSQANKLQTRPNTTAGSSNSASTTASKDYDKLRNEIQHLEKLLAEKEQVLNAVSNNQTIIQNRLKSTLLLKENEIQKMQKDADEKQQTLDRSLSIIESLTREDNLRKSNDLRQTLATDGARLGKIVHTRTNLGMSVESWEDGDAFILLRKRKQQFHEKRKYFHRLKQQQQQQSNEENNSSISSSVENNNHKPIISLQRLEDRDSLRRKLSELEKEEIDIAREEKNLKKEKSSHIRALKRLASEDNSKFRSKPKLNDRYVLLNLVGKGGFSEVWRAYDLISLQDVAVKLHHQNPMWSDAKKANYTKHVSREYEIHHEVRNPRIVSLLDVFEIDNDSFATVLEYCRGTDLDTLLKERKFLPEWEARGILLQILSGMNYLSTHSVDGARAGIIHYDLKPGNILFDEYGDAKITDFGLSKIIEGADPADSMELTSQGAGTYWYLPPECFLLDQNVRISNKVDVWSIGVIFFEMIYGTKPFGDGQTQEKLFTNQTMLNARQVKFPSANKNITKECQEFIQACLTYEQIYRPSIAEICSHSYLQMDL